MPRVGCFQRISVSKPWIWRVRGIDDRLVVQQEFAFAHRLEHRRFERDVVLRRAALARAVDHAARLAGFLGARHGGVGQRHQAHFVLGMLRDRSTRRPRRRGRSCGLSISNGDCRVASRRPVTSLIWASLWVPGRTATNSSPPTRASVSLSRSVLRRRAAARRSTASPTGWPRPSLTFLKPSRPMVATAKPWPERRACAITMRMRSDSSRRLGSSVRRVVGGHVAQPFFGGVLRRSCRARPPAGRRAVGALQADRRSSNQISFSGVLQARLRPAPGRPRRRHRRSRCAAPAGRLRPPAMASMTPHGSYDGAESGAVRARWRAG